MLTALLALTLLTPPDAAPEVQRLENGLNVIVIEEHVLPVASVQVWYAVGSADDPPTQPGLIHIAHAVVEHRADAPQRLRSLGARYESRTRPDACGFVTLVPASELAAVLEIEADRMHTGALTSATLAAACRRAVHDGRAGLDADLPGRRALQRAVYADHPCAEPGGFVASTLADLAPDRVADVIERRFAPASATLIIMGDVAPPQVFDLARRHFGDLPWQAESHRQRITEPAAGVQVLPAARDSARPGLDLAWATPHAGSPDEIALTVLLHRLGNPVDGPLHERVWQRGGYLLPFQLESWRDGGLLLLAIDQRVEVDITPGADWARQLASAVTAAIEQAAAQPCTPEQLVRARQLALRDWQSRRASTWHRMLDRGRAEASAGDVLLAEWRAARLAQVDVNDLREAARQLAAARRATRARLPQATTTSAPASKSPAWLDVAPIDTLGGRAAFETLTSHNTARGPIPSPANPTQTTTLKLDNGVNVIVCRTPDLGPITVRTLLAEPTWRESIDAALAVGSQKLTVAQWRAYLTLHGLDVLPTPELSRPGLASHGPADRVATLIEMHAGLLRRPRRDDAVIESAFRALHQAAARGFGPAADFVGEQRREPPGLLGWSAVRSFAPPVAEHVRIALDQLAFVDEVTILVVGNVDPATVRQAVQSFWGDWQPPGSPSTQPADIILGPSRRDHDKLPPTRVGWIVDATAGGEVHVGDSLFPAADKPISLRALARDAAAWSLGVPVGWPSGLDATRDWRWRWVWVEHDWLDRAAIPAADELEDFIKGDIARAQQIRTQTLTDAELKLALRLARTQRLLALTHPDLIADWIERGVENPWDLSAELDADRLRTLLPDVFSIRDRYIGGVGPHNFTDRLDPFVYPPMDERGPGKRPARSTESDGGV
jgi:zinc protease